MQLAVGGYYSDIKYPQNLASTQALGGRSKLYCQCVNLFLPPPPRAWVEATPKR